MWNIKEQIVSAAQSMKIEVKELSVSETKNIFHQLAIKYADGKNRFPLWEHLTVQLAVNNSDAWRWIGEYIADSEALLLFNPTDEKSSFAIVGGSNVVKILSEMFNVEFYVTNKAFDYLFCFNHHDVLIASGNSIEWLKKYKTPQYDRFLQ
ncbi:DUF6756 family protein [Paenactinomyces guangxiensis]|uniref:Uncharacterized protein n=1 Tax=Paenactinomyces guangxiensis TaxID=1490290 RepID=A0A7W1WUK0_9BACL|nr:DUF6756 family protein [Paenactinomyces guangxiensis]MBA4496329.1 hypothetical protein [Paenactinomyces guangxiensis]MBH8590858.1 hypothetical protein [Paenactinomyces guangxiensis]